jgi:hypothetical protein
VRSRLSNDYRLQVQDNLTWISIHRPKLKETTTTKAQPDISLPDIHLHKATKVKKIKKSENDKKTDLEMG